MAIDTEHLIIEVQLRPVLWDLRLPAYKNRDEKQSAWVDVAKKLFTDFETLEQDDKENKIKAIIQRWKSARDQYVRHKNSVLSKKSGSAAKNKKKYVFADMMSFLEPVTTLEFVEESLPLQQNETEISNMSEDGTQVSVTENSGSANLPFKRKKKDPNEMTKFEIEILKMCKTNTELSFDEDVAFFNSVLPTVRKLDLQTKFYFRSQILKLLVQCTTNQTSTQPYSSPMPSSSSYTGGSIPRQTVSSQVALSPMSNSSYTSSTNEENDVNVNEQSFELNYQQL